MAWIWKMLIRFLFSGLAVFFIAQYVSGISVDSWGTAFWAALVLGVVNTLVRPILKLITLPITFLTLGLFIFVINTAMFALTAALIEGLSIDGFIPALIGAVILTVVSWILNAFSD